MEGVKHLKFCGKVKLFFVTILLILGEREGRAIEWWTWWTYDGISGPAFWGLINLEWSLCNKGRRQSPIDLEPAKLLYDPNLRPVSIDKDRISGYLTNTGHSIIFFSGGAWDEDVELENGSTVSISGSSNGGSSTSSLFRTVVNMTGGPLSYRYKFHEIHIHFGQKDDAGSEHTVDGYAFPAELQLLGYNAQLYGNFSEAVMHSHGVVAISILLQLGDLSNPELRLLTDQLRNITYSGERALVQKLSLQGLLPSTDHYITYEGSMTMPGCYETVTWIVLNKPIYITKQQLHALRSVMQGDKDFPKSQLGNNYRPPQPLHHRPVRTNIDFNKDAQCRTSMHTEKYYKANTWKQPSHQLHHGHQK